MQHAECCKKYVNTSEILPRTNISSFVQNLSLVPFERVRLGSFGVILQTQVETLDPVLNTVFMQSKQYVQ